MRLLNSFTLGALFIAGCITGIALVILFGGLLGYFAAWLLSLIFTVDYDVAKATGIVIGGVMFPTFLLMNAKS